MKIENKHYEHMKREIAAIWTKEKVTLRTYTIVKEFRAEIATKCEGVLKSWPKARDETTNTRLALALFKAYKLSLMIRNASGQYSSVNDDEWRFGSKESRSSVLKFKPQLTSLTCGALSSTSFQQAWKVDSRIAIIFVWHEKLILKTEKDSSWPRKPFTSSHCSLFCYRE